ncbi:MAG: hypothetical protein M0P64_01150 [Candidatus Pacebacteria bacterium]|jgi:hypothetical protein|nr:hypothetical protein [Candidatus Paceibacterota bacterium]
MNYHKKNKALAFLLLFSLLSSSLFVPQGTRAATTSGSASIDCAEVTTLGTEIQTVVQEWVAAAATEMGANVTSVPVQNPGADTSTAETAGQTTGETTWQTTIKGFLDCVVYKAGQIALDKLTDQTITWIKGGMNGSPYYAIDPAQFEQDLIGAVAGNLSAQIRGLELCEFDTMFKNDLANWLVVGSTGNADLKFQKTVACPFKQINASEFYSGAQAFTWQYFETALNDSGNPFGVSVVAQNEYTKQQAAEAARAKQQLDWGQGFLSVVDTSDCQWPDDMTEQAVVNGASYNDEGATLSETEIAAYQRAYCKKVTPAQLIQSQLTKSTESEWDRLGFADNLNKIISAFVTKVSNDAVKGIFKK